MHSTALIAAGMMGYTLRLSLGYLRVWHISFLFKRLSASFWLRRYFVTTWYIDLALRDIKPFPKIHPARKLELPSKAKVFLGLLDNEHYYTIRRGPLSSVVDCWAANRRVPGWIYSTGKKHWGPGLYRTAVSFCAISAFHRIDVLVSMYRTYLQY